MFLSDDLIQNNEFIKWVSKKEFPDKLLWDNRYESASGVEKENFNNAIKTIQLLNTIDVNTSIAVKSNDEIESGLRQLHQDVKKLKFRKTILFRSVLKYAAAIVFLLSIGVAVFINYNKTVDVFCNNLAVAESFSNDKLLIESNGFYYEIPEKTQSWITKDGIEVEITNKRISLAKPQNLNIRTISKIKIYIPFRKQFEVDLLDGTNVHLNANTEFEFSIDTKSSTRITKLKGEGYFDVAHNPVRPFIVETNRMYVEVLGTEFNVTAYNNESVTEATLVSGSVKVSTTKGTSTVIKPGDIASTICNSNEIVVTKANISNTTLWMSESLQLHDNRLGDLLLHLSRWYGVNFTYNPNELKDVRFSGELRKNMELDEILNKLKYTDGIDFVINDNIANLSK